MENKWRPLLQVFQCAMELHWKHIASTCITWIEYFNGHDQEHFKCKPRMKIMKLWYEHAERSSSITVQSTVIRILKGKLKVSTRIQVDACIPSTRIQVDACRPAAGCAIFGVFKWNFDSHARYLDFETRVLHRVSSRTYLAEWFGLGSHFGKHASFSFISKNKVSIFWKSTRKMLHP